MSVNTIKVCCVLLSVVAVVLCCFYKYNNNNRIITINIYYSGENNNAVKFIQEMIKTGTVAKIRQEEGNLKYEYFYPMDDKNTVLLIDSWQSQKYLDKHHQSSIMKTIAELREKYNLHMRVERYVEDTNYKIDRDKKFIRK